MRIFSIFKSYPAYILIIVLFSCNKNAEKTHESTDKQINNDSLFIQTMQKHLDAVSNKDIKTLESTLSPNGEMQLILPSSEIIYSAEKFLDYHRDWFKDTTWTFETKILNTDVSNDFGMAITEIVYREPDREGEPYFNRMTVSYDLKKIDGNWYIIKDHASSIEKSTDQK